MKLILPRLFAFHRAFTSDHGTDHFNAISLRNCRPLWGARSM